MPEAPDIHGLLTQVQAADEVVQEFAGILLLHYHQMALADASEGRGVEARRRLRDRLERLLAWAREMGRCR